MRYGTPDVLIGIGGAGKNIIYNLLAPSYGETGGVDELEVSDLRNWTVDEVLEPRGDSNHRSEKLDCFAIDTDTQEQNNDRPLCRRLNELLGERVDDHEREVTPPTIDYLNIAEEARTDASYLLNDEYLRDKIKRQTGLSCWWLWDGPRMIDPMENFDKGVIRRRAISKALFYTAQYQHDNPISELQGSVDASDDIGIVVGLGGGTGSGMFLDIARALRSQGNPPITLFAILPQVGDIPDTGANAYAALSELEYLALTNQNPFTNIVLLPYLDDASETEFDEAIVRTILSYYNLAQNDPALLDESDDGRGPPRFAPFTIAATQMLQYEGAGLQETKDQFDEYYRQKKSLLDAESDLYDAAESLLEDHYSDDDTVDVYARYSGRGAEGRFSLDDSEVADIYSRIEALGELVDLEELSSIGYDVAEELSSDFESSRQNALDLEGIVDESAASRSEVRRAIVNQFPEQAEGGSSFNGSNVDKPGNEKLIELYEREIQAIKRRRDLLRAKNMLEGADIGAGDVMESEHVSDALEQAFRGGYTSNTTPEVKGRLDDLETEVRDQRETVDDWETIEEGLEGSEDESDTLEGELESWRAEVEDDLEQLEHIYEHGDEIESLLDELADSIKGAIKAAHRAGESSNVPSAGPDGSTVEFDRFDDLNEKLEKCGLEPIQETDINEQVKAVWKAREAWLKKDEGGGFLRRGPDVQKLENRHTKHYRTVRNAEADFVWLPSWENRSSESAKFRTTEFEERKEALDGSEVADGLVDSVSRYVENPGVTVGEILSEETKSSLNDPSKVTDLGALGTEVDLDLESALERLETDGTGVEDVLDELCAEGGAVYAAFHDAFLADVETERETAQENLDDLENEENRYEMAEKVVDRGSTYADRVDRPGSPEEISAVENSGKESGSHITRRWLDDAGPILNNDDISEPGFWSDERGEREAINATLEEFTERIERSHLPLRNPSISAPTKKPDKPKYDQHRLLTMFSSRMFEQAESDKSDAVVPAVQDSLRDSLTDPIETTHQRWRRISFGGPWDLSMTMFFGGVMFDNLALFYRGGNGYKEKYESKRRPDDDSIIVRHVHGIDGLDRSRFDDYELIGPEKDGAYLYRESILNLQADEDDKAFLLNHIEEEDELIRDLLDRYDVTEFESTFDLEDD